MLRIHFNAEDLTRISIAAAADPLWEIVLSRITLQERYPPPQFVPWWKAVRDDPWRRARVEPGARVLATLAPLGPYFPDFLTPSDASLDLDSGLERVCGTPRRRIRGEFDRFTRTSRVPMPSRVRPLADADSSALTRLTILLRDYYRSAIAPQGRLVRSAVEADRARRARAVLDSGVEGLLASSARSCVGVRQYWRSATTWIGNCTSAGGVCAWCRPTSATDRRSRLPTPTCYPCWSIPSVRSADGPPSVTPTSRPSRNFLEPPERPSWQP